MKLEEKLGIKFKDENLLKTALTHSSYANENGTLDNERLEYLGDAVLELLMSDYLYKDNSLYKEGEMTQKRAQSVCEKALVKYAKIIDLPKYLYLGNGEEQSGGRNRDAIIADAFEALLGAIYLDLGFVKAKEFFDKVVVPNISFFDVIDYKTRLQELLQAEKRSLEYIKVKEEGPAHNPLFEMIVVMDKELIMGRGIGRSKKEAEQNAAKQAYEKLAK